MMLSPHLRLDGTKSSFILNRAVAVHLSYNHAHAS